MRRQRKAHSVAVDVGSTVAGGIEIGERRPRPVGDIGVHATICEAVAEGRITDEQADELRSNLAERVEGLVNGELPLRGAGFRGPRGPGGGGPFGGQLPETPTDTTA